VALTSTSTYAEIQAEVFDTALYEFQSTVSAQLSMAKLHLQARVALSLRQPTTSIKGSNTVSYNMATNQDEIDKVQAFIRSREPANTVRVDFRQMRTHG